MKIACGIRRSLYSAVCLIWAGCALAQSRPYVLHNGVYSETVDNSKVNAGDLRTEYQIDPLCLDTTTPRFSWALIDPLHARGQKQTAYQLIVSSTREGLAAERGDLWNSGIVQGADTLGIIYRGRPLKVGNTCFWKVKIWDKKTRLAHWSAVAKFSIGPQVRDDWRGKWIGMQAAGDAECPWFRKEITLGAIPREAILYVGSVGYHELYVNGKKADNRVLAPSVSDLEKRALYNGYDVRALLKPGKNVIGIWLAPGWAHFSDANPDKISFNLAKSPLCIAQMHVEDSNGLRIEAATDSTWSCSLSGTRHLGSCHNGDFGGDRVDGAVDSLLWSTPEFQPSSATWSPAAEYPLELELSPDLAEPNRRCDTLTSQSLTHLPTGEYRFEMNHLFSGWIEVNLNGEPGSTITIKASSLPDRAIEYNQEDQYVVGPSGTGVFCNRFSYHECKYVTISGLKQAPSLGDVMGYRISNDRERIGGFDCSNAILKKIYDTTLNTYVNLSTGGMTVDCPHRERLGYGGDGHTSMELALDAFESDRFFNQWAQDWCDIQLATGRIYHTAPTMGGGGGPAWSGFVITMPWEVYRATADLRILQNTYPTARRWLAYLDQFVGQDGLLQPLPGGYWLFLGDWVTPHGSEGADKPEALLFNNCYYLYVTRIAEKVARLLDKTDDAHVFDLRATKLAAAINKRFYHAATSSYLDTRQTHLVMPLISEAVPTAREPEILNSLEKEIVTTRNGHLDTGLHGTYFMTRYLTDIQRSDLVFLYATKPGFPGYVDLLDKGYETWPEEWAGSDSRMHGCLNGIGGWFQRGLAGIQPDDSAPGYRKFTVRPAFVGDLTSVSAYHISPYGRIDVKWKKTNNTITLDVTVPPNCSATVYLPSKDASLVTESKKPLKNRFTLSAVRQIEGIVAVEVEAGIYHFSAVAP